MFALAFSSILASRLGYKLDNRMARGEIPYDWFPNVKPETDGIETGSFAIEINDTVASMDAAVHWGAGYRISVYGFFERAEFYTPYRDLLCHLFYQPEAKCGKETVFHVRGGDFLHDGQGKLLPAGYYKEAWERLGRPNVTVITDDVSYAAGLLEYSGIAIEDIITHEPRTAFLAMRSANNLVTSHSTLSWWAGFLSGARVIQPKKAGGFNFRNLEVKTWEQIEHP